MLLKSTVHFVGKKEDEQQERKYKKMDELG